MGTYYRFAVTKVLGIVNVQSKRKPVIGHAKCQCVRIKQYSRKAASSLAANASESPKVVGGQEQELELKTW
jgi:hypothetical protein